MHVCGRTPGDQLRLLRCSANAPPCGTAQLAYGAAPPFLPLITPKPLRGTRKTRKAEPPYGAAGFRKELPESLLAFAYKGIRHKPQILLEHQKSCGFQRTQPHRAHLQQRMPAVRFLEASRQNKNEQNIFLSTCLRLEQLLHVHIWPIADILYQAVVPYLLAIEYL